MKKTKLFLTVTTFCLAIAAVATTKANSRINETGYTQGGDGKCTVSSGIDCNGTGTSCKNGSAQLYRFNSGGACSVTLAKP